MRYLYTNKDKFTYFILEKVAKRVLFKNCTKKIIYDLILEGIIKIPKGNQKELLRYQKVIRRNY
jgi:hypothetical protein